LDNINIERYSNILSNETNFIFFTDLLRSKIVGGLVSKDIDEKVINELKEIVDERKFFDCPACGESIHLNMKEIAYQCDCGKSINTEFIPFQKRYRMKKDFFDSLKNFFSQKFIHSNQNFIICFGEKTKTNFQHDGQIVIHVTPFDVWGKNKTAIIKTLDTAYVDHFLIFWDVFNKTIVYEEREKIFDSILRLRRETIEKQIDWKKINDGDFEKLSLELLENERKFSKIVPGGKGPDQGKDGFGYYTMKMPSGKEVQVKTLIQCKFTLSTKSFPIQDIQMYITRAKQHHCSSLLFITNGELSGDAISAMDSGAFNEKDFYDVDFYNAKKLMDLLEKYDDVRIKYFFTPLVNNENT